MYISREGEVSHLSCKNKLLTLKNTTKMSQAERSILAALLRVTLLFGRDMPPVRSTSLRKKHLPGRTTAQPKLNRPIIDCYACNRTLRHFWYVRSSRLTLSNLSCGNRASMRTESISRPIKVKHVYTGTYRLIKFYGNTKIITKSQKLLKVILACVISCRTKDKKIIQNM